MRYGIFYQGRLAQSFLIQSKAERQAYLLIKARGWNPSYVEVKPVTN